MRYADDFVALAKQMGSETIEFIESRLEGKFQLEINREKTRVVDLREEGASLNFLGYTFRYDRDLKGRDRKYLNVFPSKKAVQRAREKLHEMTDRHQCHKPIPVLIGELNRHLKGWVNYFSIGYPTSAYCEIERYVQDRLIQHLQRRSQRPYRPPQGESWLGHLARLGLIRLSELRMPEARVFRRAGRGKSASPVRRGESGSRSCIALSPTLPAPFRRH